MTNLPTGSSSPTGPHEHHVGASQQHWQQPTTNTPQQQHVSSNVNMHDLQDLQEEDREKSLTSSSDSSHSAKSPTMDPTSAVPLISNGVESKNNPFDFTRKFFSRGSSLKQSPRTSATSSEGRASRHHRNSGMDSFKMTNLSTGSSSPAGPHEHHVGASQQRWQQPTTNTPQQQQHISSNVNIREVDRERNLTSSSSDSSHLAGPPTMDPAVPLWSPSSTSPPGSSLAGGSNPKQSSKGTRVSLPKGGAGQHDQNRLADLPPLRWPRAAATAATRQESADTLKHDGRLPPMQQQHGRHLK